MIDDPWAITDNKPVANTGETVNVATTEPKLKTILKAGPGYDAPWETINADSVEEMKTLVREVMESGLLGLINEASRAFAGVPTVKPAFQQPATQQNFPSPTPPAVAPSGDAKTCGHTDENGNYVAHGEMKFKNGVNKTTGNPWKGHFCPRPKGDPDQCRPVFV